jgi:hypothetical protein
MLVSEQLVYQIGSGTIESGCKQITSQRLEAVRGSMDFGGARWTLEGDARSTFSKGSRLEVIKREPISLVHAATWLHMGFISGFEGCSTFSYLTTFEYSRL